MVKAFLINLYKIMQKHKIILGKLLLVKKMTVHLAACLTLHISKKTIS